MSFSTDVKTELTHLSNANCCNRAELSALFHIGGSMELNSEGLHVLFQSSHLGVIRKAVSLIKSLYSVEITLTSKKQIKFKKHDMYVIRIDQSVNRILQELSLMGRDGIFFQDLSPEIVSNDCCKRAYLRGAFLAGGSLNRPETATYHLEIQCFSEKQAHSLMHIANHYELKAKIAKNKRGFIVYLKEAEKIADFLRVTGATQALFMFEDNRIKRDFKNSINRVINCDIANERKALDAASQQLDHIKLIEDKLKPNQITKSMQEAIFLRKKYPESTLLELSYASQEFLKEPLSKSALNHRFRAIRDLANRLQIEEEHS
ncbi:MAG: DNA-binding protein WhiA [Candidatus Izemoplasmatales bacterium]|jgi:hypothetical protein